MSRLPPIPVLVAAALAAWLVLPRTRGEVRLTAPPPPNGEPLRPGTAVGVSGCLAAACHGGPAADALAGKPVGSMWPASGTCWVARDPHAAAYDSLARGRTRLGGPPARDIMAKLGGTAPATEDVRCLACHTNPALADASSDPRRLDLRRDGVSCEACHGNASGWVRSHTAGDFTGMNPLREVGDRATACVGCHVGAPADSNRNYPVRDMNHDMIAAGHPRLDFDYAEYLRRLPKHWREKQPASPAREWLVGRVVHAEAACRLLADRADRATKDDPRTPWPEFAEFDCASCHHQTPQSWRNEPVHFEKRTPGSLRWQTIWPATYPFPLPTEFDPVKPVLATMGASRPAGAAKTSAVASGAATRMAEFRRSLAAKSDGDVVRLAVKFFPNGLGDRPDWDTAGQMLLGAAALERTRIIPREPSADFARAFGALRRRDWNDLRAASDRLLLHLPRRTDAP